MKRLLFILLLSFSFTATLLVPEEYSTIQSAIDASSDGDTILVSAGTYYENINFNGKNISVIGEDRETTVIDAMNQAVVLNIDSDVYVEGFTLTNGMGGINIISGNLVLESINIIDNMPPDLDQDLSYDYFGIRSNYSSLIANNIILQNNMSIYEIDFNYSTFDLNKVVVISPISVGEVNEQVNILFSDGTIRNSTFHHNYMENYSYNLQISSGSNVNIINTILYDGMRIWCCEPNSDDPIVNISYSYINNCDCEFDYIEGLGLINEDPQFTDLDNNDYTLQPTSPCIDTGDPNSELDPDGTRADMGAYYFHQTSGCTDPEACNYNEEATIDDGSCTGPYLCDDMETLVCDLDDCIMLGCTNPDASNYNPDAEEDDGSCCIELWGECYNIEETTSLSLDFNGLTGEIPSEIGNLTNLTYLNLYHNQLIGEIPSEIGNLINLEFLSLSDNELSGEIPLEIGNLTNLTDLWIDNNELTGEIPSSIGNLINLTYFSLHANQLLGEIPSEIGNLTNLTRFYSDSNQLTGEIPPEIGNLTNLTNLGLHTNQFTGELPLEFSNLVNLEYLYLYNNQLTGEIPEYLCTLDNLYLEFNNFCGPYPDCISQDAIDSQDTSECEPILGDINGDFELNVQDIIVIIDLILAPGYPADYYEIADMNQDGVLNIYDIIFIINIILGN